MNSKQRRRYFRKFISSASNFFKILDQRISEWERSEISKGGIILELKKTSGALKAKEYKN